MNWGSLGKLFNFIAAILCERWKRILLRHWSGWRTGSALWSTAHKGTIRDPFLAEYNERPRVSTDQRFRKDWSRNLNERIIVELASRLASQSRARTLAGAKGLKIPLLKSCSATLPE